MVVEDGSEFQPDQCVRVREEGGDPSSRPDKKLLGKEGTIEYPTGTLERGLPTSYLVEIGREVFAISADWLESAE